ncbi:MAG: RidA family protein [Clostridiaceae bacterium]|nr:RidA family protein [Clostridiaceae bacterium]
MQKQIVQTDKAPAAIGPYSQAIIIGDPVYTSGQLPLDPATGTMPVAVADQARQSLRNIQAILEAAGSSMDKVVKTTVFLKDMNTFAEMNAACAEFFTEGTYPARSAVEVARLPKDAMLEIEAIALK